MDALWEIVVAVGHAIEQVLGYVDTHHWIFGFLALGYMFYLHDRGFTRASTRSTSGSMKSGSGSRSSIDRLTPGGRRHRSLLQARIAGGARRIENFRHAPQDGA